MRQQIIQIPLPTLLPPQSTHVRPPCQSFAFEYTETPSAAADQTLPSQCTHTPTSEAPNGDSVFGVICLCYGVNAQVTVQLV